MLSLSRMKILLTGAEGQVGRAVRQLAPAGNALVGLSHRELDIADRAAVEACVQRHRPAVIVNAAAYTAVDRAEAEPEVAERVNAQGPAHLAAAARHVGSRLVHVSTDFVFDGLTSTPYRPEAPTHPLNVYGLTKRRGEEAVLRALPEAVVLRTAWVYAAEGRNFLRTMLRLMATNGAVRVVSDQIGTPTAARSAAVAIWKIIGSPHVQGIHHWTDAGVASWYDFAVAIAEEGAALGLLAREVTVSPITADDYPTAARRPRFSVLDRSSLAALGIPPLHWRAALRAVLREIQPTGAPA